MGFLEDFKRGYEQASKPKRTAPARGSQPVRAFCKHTPPRNPRCRNCPLRRKP